MTKGPGRATVQGINIGVTIRFKNPPRFAQPWDQLYRDHLAYAQRVDALGFDGIWVAEHHCTPQGYDPAPLVALTAISQVTKSCMLGTQPLLLPLRNPVLVAEEAAAVDLFSGGRLMLGVGLGYLESDFNAVGVPRKERGARMDEALDILCKALWETEQFDYEGRFYNVRGVAISPRPVQKQVRMEVVIRSEAAAKRIARPGMDVNMNSMAVAQELGPKVAEIAHRAGRDPADVGISLLASGFLAATEERARTLTRPYSAEDANQYIQYWSHSNDEIDRVMSAQVSASQAEGRQQGNFTAQALIDAIHANIETMAATGLKPGWLNLTLWPAGMPVTDALDCLERVARDVLPQIPRRGQLPS